jgi:hypothetical protein
VHILYLSDIRFPIERANGMQSMETAHALVRRGHVVTLGVRPDVVRPARDPFAFYGLPPDARLRIVRAPIGGPHRLRRIEFLAWAAARVMAARGVDVVFTRDLGVADLVRRVPRRPPLARLRVARLRARLRRDAAGSRLRRPRGVSGQGAPAGAT